MSYRILSLDGGGSWALIQIKALMEIYGPNGASKSGREVLSDFDLVAANSGGSIVLACLVEDMTLGRALDFFNDEDERRRIFSPTHNLFERALSATDLVPKYSASQKLVALRAVLPRAGDVPLRGITKEILSKGGRRPVHLLITSFDYDRNRAVFLRSAAIKSAAWGTGSAASVTLAEGVDASTNAPVRYFDGPAEFSGTDRRYWDGAVGGFNNPILAAVTEAVGIGVNPAEIVALSIGTGIVLRPLADSTEPSSPLLQPRSRVGVFGDLEKIAESIIGDPPDAASFFAHVMTGSGAGITRTLPDGRSIDSRIVRMNPRIGPIVGTISDGERPQAPGGMTDDAFRFLAGLDLDAITQQQVDAITDYTNLWLADSAPNQPVRLNGDTFQAELGQDRFSDALHAWKALSQT